MKKSRYNFIRKTNGQHVLYNAKTEITAILDPLVSELYTTNSPEDIQNKHPDFYNYLVSNKFIIPKSFNELESLINDWERLDSASDYFTLSINPTLNCNLCCWYCYENHKGELGMTPKIVDRIKKFIVTKLSDPQIEQFHLGFFGGEPLLNFDKIGRDLLDYTCTIGAKLNKKISASFVSNGVLITDSFLRYLQEKNIHISFQITLDGNEKTHDAIRHTKSGGSTYRKILTNVSEILTHSNMEVTLRCNFTEHSLASFFDVVTDIRQWHKKTKIKMSQMIVDLHRVWQDKKTGESESLLILENQVREAFKSADISITIEQPSNRYRCYAERRNNVLVNFNGDLFRCTARDFKTEQREGILSADGELVWNENSQKRDSVKWSNKTCHECNIYPICCGTCSQSRIENIETSGCDYNYTADNKEKIVTDRIMWLLEQSRVSMSETTNC